MSFVQIILLLINLYDGIFLVNGNVLSSKEIDQLRIQIMDKIDAFSNEFSPSSDKPLAAHIIRLIFHDCAGPENIGTTQSTVNNDKRLCDGCIDLDLRDHQGLQNMAVEPLEALYNEYKSRISRADFWASIGNIALEYTASFSTKPGELPVLPYYFGRIDCPLSPNTVTRPGLQGTEFPMAHLGWDHAFDFFKDKLGLGLRETTAIFGAHTLGKMHKSNSGFDGQWTHQPHIFDNQFFVELWNRDNQWDQTFIGSTTNEPLEFPQWINNIRGTHQNTLTMLNSDYSLLVKIDEPIDNPPLDENTGIVTCRIRDFDLTPGFDRCSAEISHYSVRDFAEDNQAFYDQFVKGWNKILTNNQVNLVQVIPNRFMDNRHISPSPNVATSDRTSNPISNPTSNPTLGPTSNPTKNPIEVISDETPLVSPSYLPSKSPAISPSYCCIANKIPNWNGRCWSKTDEISCNGVNSGRRCHWDPTQCRTDQLCFIRDIPCTSALQCCSRRCRRDNARCS